MRSHVRLVSLLCCLLVGAGCSQFASAVAAGPFAQGATTGGGMFDSSLTVPAMQLLDGGRQKRAARAALRVSLDRRALRLRSRDAYRGLSAQQAAALARSAYPTVIDSPATEAAPLPPGARVEGYTGAFSERIALPGNKHEIADSLQPLSAPTSSGKRVAIDLGLVDRGGSYAPAHAAAPVSIPKQLDQGVRLTDSAIAMTPVDAQGTPLSAGVGRLVGATTLFANSQTDADTVVKPLPGGFAEDTMLRSAASPQRLAYRLTLPDGARLRRDARSGSVRVMQYGRQIALVAPPSAHDADGTTVALSMRLAGDTIVLDVKHRAGDYRYPIAVDPEIADSLLLVSSAGNWCSQSERGWCFTSNSMWFQPWRPGGALGDIDTGSVYQAGEYGAWNYISRGASHINGFWSVTQAANPYPDQADNLLAIVDTGGYETSQWVGYTYASTGILVCPYSSCAGTSGANGNVAFFEQYATAGASYVETQMTAATIYLNQTAGPTASFDTADATIVGQPNALHNTWVSAGTIKFTLNDPGMGVYQFNLESPGNPSWTPTLAWGVHPASNCLGYQCDQETSYTATVANLPEGMNTIKTTVGNAVGLTSFATAPLGVDKTVPSVTVAGVTEGQLIGDGSYHIEATANDGTAPTASSGVASVSIAVDGQQVVNNTSGCTPGPCQQLTDYQLNGREFGQGPHAVVATVTDYAGNVASKTVNVNVNEGSAVAAGPGKVNTTTGEFSLSATDVSIKSFGTDLTVGRAYDSRNISSSATSVLGPSWRLSYGGMESLSVSGNVVVFTDATGHHVTFGPGLVPPAGYKDMKLTQASDPVKGILYTLTDSSGNVTTFAQTIPFIGPGLPWVPVTQTGTAGSDTTNYTFELAGLDRPTRALAPVPAGVSCSPTLTKGCRALGFSYGVSTTATSEAPAGWGDYAGRLKQVTFTAWDTATSAMSTKVVAQYSYDSAGRLRAEWDPRISPALKMTYGYDAAGHVTAMSPPGQEPWAFAYSSIADDANTGRLASVTRPAASVALGNGSAPANTVLPALSTTSPTMGTNLSVTTGTWSNSPVAYSYQWQDCESGGVNCTSIVGATNHTYTPLASDGGYYLVARVTAISAGGAVTVGSAASNQVPSAAPTYSAQFGSAGSGNGQFNKPRTEAIDASGNLWVTDGNNNRVEKFSAAGAFLASYGSLGTGNGQFTGPMGIAINTATGNVYVVDQENNRVEELSSAGTFIRSFGSAGTGAGMLSAPAGIAVDPSGNVWVADFNNNRVEEFSATGIFMRTLGSAGTGDGQFANPLTIAFSGGNMYVVDYTNNRIQEFSAAGAFIRKWGSFGGANGQFNQPFAIVTDPGSGDLYVSDRANNRVQKFTPNGVYLNQVGSAGSGNGQFNQVSGLAVDSAGTVYAADQGGNRIEKFTLSLPTTEPQQAAPTPGTSSVLTMAYHVSLSGGSAPYAMGSSDVATWGQSQVPTDATAIFPPDQPVASPPANYQRAAIYYMDANDRTVNVAAPGGRITTSEFDANGQEIRSLSAINRQRSLEAGAGSAAKSHLLDIQSTYSADGIQLLTVLGPERTVQLAAGTQVQARHRKAYIYDQGAPGGVTYRLITSFTEGAQISGQPEADIHTKTYSYSAQSNYGWTNRVPTSSKTDSGGLNLVTTSVYDTSTGNVTEIRKPANAFGGDARSTQIVYYSAAANATVPACGLHPEWANLPCQTQPAAQPGTAGLPALALRTYTYNMWNEPLTTKDTNGATIRTVTDVYDAAGRPQTDSITSTIGTALPTTTTTYDPEQGAIATQSTTVAGTTKTLTSVYNKLGQLTGYTDADGNAASYTYDIDGRRATANDGKGTQTYTYDATTGDLSTLVDSAAGTFTAGYDAGGELTSQVYPNGMTATSTYDAAGEQVGLKYVKTSNCSSNCTWLDDQVTPSIHGQWLSRTGTLSSQAYKYDTSGRLTQVQDTPAGQGCTTRIYAYDQDTNRTGLTTRAPNADQSCDTTAGHGTTAAHTYDVADRLTDAGVVYNDFGDITTLPAADAGGNALTSTYYADDTVASQTQNGLTVTYKVDPSGRVREEVSSGTSSATTLSHYANSGDSPAWTIDGAGTWTRFIPGIAEGMVASVQSGQPAVLSLRNLHGDIVATASLSTTATSLVSTGDTTEFGVPRTASPARYSWLGAAQRPTELASGVVQMGARSYVPQLGRFMQVDPVVGGSPNDYAYTFGDPMMESDLEGSASLGWLEAMQASPPNVPAPQEQIDPYQPEPTYDDGSEAVGTPGPRAAHSLRGGPIAGIAGFNPLKFFKKNFNRAVNGCYITYNPFLCGENAVDSLKHDFGISRSMGRYIVRHFKASFNTVVGLIKIAHAAADCYMGGRAAVQEVIPALNSLEPFPALYSTLYLATFAIGCTEEMQTSA